MQIAINVLSIITSLVLLSILVTVHELGHYGMGRLLGFKIEEFAIGLGPKVFSRERKGILYSIRALPIGGMCRFYGEDEGAESELSMNAQKAWKRLLVILAGPVMNILCTFLLSAIFLMSYGDFVYRPTVESLSEEIPIAAEAGMLPEDILYAVDGVVIDYKNQNPQQISDQTTALIRAAEQSVSITVERAGELHEIVMQDIYNEAEGRNLIGINLAMGVLREPYGFFSAIGRAFPFVFDLVKQTFQAIGGMVQNGVQEGDVTGVVGTVALISYAVRTDFEIVLYIAILLSISLAIFNLLPIPALDGGRVVFILIEMIRGKPIPPEKEGMVHLIGFVLLMGLVLVVTFGDIKMLIGG